MKKVLAVFLSVSLMLASFVCSFADVNQNTGSVTPQVQSEIRANLVNLGVTNKATQDSLIKKFCSGQTWDSMNPAKVSKIPVTLITPTLNQPVKSYTFPDGSVLRCEIQAGSASKKIVARAGGSGYQVIQDLRISRQAGVMLVGFTVDYCVVQGGYDYIMAVRKPYCNVVGGSYSNLQAIIQNQYETGNSPAKAYGSADISFVSGAGATMYTTFNLKNDSYTVTGY